MKTQHFLSSFSTNKRDMDSFEIIKTIKAGNAYTHNTWTIQKSGSKFKLTKSDSTIVKILPERAIQRILNNIL